MSARHSIPTHEGELSDRRLRDAEDIDRLSFGEGGLLPVVAQDATNGSVLMVAWASREALLRSLETGELHFWSRSRQALWRKGESSGNVLAVESLHADCDGDVVLARVAPAGPACHTGEATCFGDGALGPLADDPNAPVLDALWQTLESRARERPEGSYTTRLLADENLRLKKLGEETAELVASLARAEKGRVPAEAADLVYHLLVALLGAGVEWGEVLSELEGRRR